MSKRKINKKDLDIEKDIDKEIEIEQEENMDEEEDMSMTFIADVKQKSAVAEDPLNDVSGFPDIKIDPPKEERKKEEQDNELTSNHNKKGLWILITIILVILSLIIGFMSATFLQEKKEAQEKEVPKEEKIEKEIEEELSTDSLYLKELISNYDGYSVESTYKELYSKEKTTVEKMDDNYLRVVAAIKANHNPINMSFTREEFQNAVLSLFGNEVTLEDKEISIDKCHKLTYHDDTLSYKMEESEDCSSSSNAIKLERKIVNAKQDNDNLEISVAIALIDEKEDKVYKEYSNDTLTKELDDMSAKEFDIESDYSKLEQYKYKFDYDSSNHTYNLNSIELIKS